MMKHRIKMVVLASALICFAASAAPASSQMFMFENPLVGEKAPDFTLKNLAGKDVNYQTLVKGKNSIIFFWATWCPHCREAMKEFNGRKEEFKSRNVEMVLVDVDEDPQKVASHVKRHNIAFDVLFDRDSAVSEEYGVIGFPTFVFVDKKGIVKDVQHELPEDYEELFK